MEEIGNGRDGTLTRRVLAFQRTGDGLQELIEDLALRIYRFPRIRRGCGEDDCGEFYLFFFPRLIKILGRFRDQGLPFESYLHAVLGWQLRSYVRRRRQEERCWETARRPELWEEAEAGGQAREEAAPAGEGLLQGLAERLGVDPEGVIRRAADRRRFLLFALKRVRELGEAELAAAAVRAGVPAAEIRRQAEELLGRLARREARLARVRERRNRAFARLTLLERQRAEEGGTGLPGGAGKAGGAGRAGGAGAAGLDGRIARARRRLREAQRVISRIPLQPSNRDLAEVLGIPKGSVDTSLYWLHRRLRQMEAAEEKGYA